MASKLAHFQKPEVGEFAVELNDSTAVVVGWICTVLRLFFSASVSIMVKKNSKAASANTQIRGSERRPGYSLDFILCTFEEFIAEEKKYVFEGECQRIKECSFGLFEIG